MIDVGGVYPPCPRREVGINWAMPNTVMPNNPECCKISWKDSLVDTAKRLISNPRLAPSKVASERMLICEACDKYSPLTTTCDVCHCIMPLKTTFANMSCPLGKWQECGEGEEDAN
jgi:predicted nucleic acid binding AN1-type Zn finger protein